MTDIKDWLRLWHIPGIGPRTFNFLVSKFDTPTKVFQSNYITLLESGASSRIANAIISDQSEQYLTDLAWAKADPRHHIVTKSQPEYPSQLREISDPPPLLYLIGDPCLLNYQPNIALVGGRKATSLGKSIAHEFSRQLANLGIIIVSGLARGIDSQAHRGALASHSGKTIAVLANGLDMIYPAEHQTLSHDIIDRGLLVSEFSPGVKPLPQHFPRRNRIISGLSIGSVVIEAAAKSGSLITARYALEQNREVFAVPGPINNPLNAGCHTLIQDGAKLVTNIEDILVELQCVIETNETHNCSIKKHRPLSSESKALLEHLDYSPISAEALISKCGLTPEQVSSMLIELEIGDAVACDAFGQYSRIATDVK